MLSFIAITISTISSRASTSRANSLPSELQGVWRTDDPKYRDRYLDLDEHYLVFGVGEDEHPNVQRVQRIVLESIPQGTRYTVYADDADGSESRLTFEYTANNGGELRLTNPRFAVWKKTGFK